MRGCNGLFPVPVQILGLVAGLLFVATSLQILAGAHLTPLSSPLPFFACPLFVAT